MDAVDDESRVRALEQRASDLGLPFFRISGASGEGLGPLLEATWQRLADAAPPPEPQVEEEVVPLNDARARARAPQKEARGRAGERRRRGRLGSGRLAGDATPPGPSSGQEATARVKAGRGRCHRKQASWSRRAIGDDGEQARRHPGRHIRSHPLRSSRCGSGRAGGARSRRGPGAALQHSAASSAAAGVGVPPLRDGRAGDRRARGLARAGSRIARRGAIVHLGYAGAIARRGFRRHRTVLHRRRRRLCRDPTWKNYPSLLDLAHFIVVSRPGVPVAELPARLGTTYARASASAEAAADKTMIFLIDAMTADVSSTAIRRCRAQGESIAGMVPPAVQQHIEQHALYEDDDDHDGDRYRGDRRARQAGCMAKTEKRRKPQRIPREVATGDRGGRRQESGRRARCSTCGRRRGLRITF